MTSSLDSGVAVLGAEDGATLAINLSPPDAGDWRGFVLALEPEWTGELEFVSTNGRRDGRGEADGFAGPGEESSEGDRSELISIPPDLSFLQGKKQLSDGLTDYTGKSLLSSQWLSDNRRLGKARRSWEQRAAQAMTTQEKDSPGGTLEAPSSTVLQHETISSRTGKLGVDEGQCCARGNIGRTRCFEVFCCTQGRLGFLFWCVSLLFPMPAISAAAAKPPRRNIFRCIKKKKKTGNHKASR